MQREPNTEYILSLSYGKDSLACLGAIEELGLPLDRIVHAEVWATDTISADLPPMVEFKTKADKIIKERWGIDVEHICAMKDGEKLTYEKMFYHTPKRRSTSRERERERERRVGFASNWYPHCRMLKVPPISRVSSGKGKLVQETQNRKCSFNIQEANLNFSNKHQTQGADINIVSYLGIAADEPIRIERHKDSNILPLVEIGWDEAYCMKWCKKNDLLSPIYNSSKRGGCWFCHNQGIDQLRMLRKEYPEYWQLLMKWDIDSPISFKPNGRTIHDFDKRFELEDQGLLIPNDTKFRWKYILSDDGEISIDKEVK